MDRTLRQHISHLEERIKSLNHELIASPTQAERNVIKAEIRVAELALTHYRTALSLEDELNPPTHL